MTNFNVIYNIIAQDKFSAVGKKFAAIASRIRQKTTSMGAALDRARAKFNRLNRTVGKAGRSMVSFGKKMLRVSAGGAVASANAIRLYDKQAMAVAKVKALIKSTGGTAKLTFRQLADEASRLQNKTILGDESILEKSTAQLLTFTNITGKQFFATQKAAINLSTVLGTDLRSTSIQLGKALNDPVTNLSALSRSGIQFSEKQKAVIHRLAKTNRLAEAQDIILKELGKQYGGTAEAVAKAGAGPLKQLWNILGDINELIGKELMIILTPLIALIKELALKFQATSPMVKKVVAILLLVVTVLGPLIIGLGLLVQLMPFLIAGFGMLAVATWAAMLPFIKIIAVLAVAYLAYLGIKAILDEFPILWEILGAVMNHIVKQIKMVVAGFMMLWKFGVRVYKWLKGFPIVWKILSASIKFLIFPLLTIVRLFKKIMSFNFSGVLDKVKGLFGGGDTNINTTSTSKSTVDVNVNAPQGAVKSVKSRSSGGAKLNVGTNMVATAG